MKWNDEFLDSFEIHHLQNTSERQDKKFCKITVILQLLIPFLAAGLMTA
jgi:hypothetical protein